MQIVITEWALQSYLEHLNIFTQSEYRKTLRPDVELLRDYPYHQRFRDDKFWGPCKDKSGKTIREGYKMKWHNIGHGRAQLRLLVFIENDIAYLCNAYVKKNPNKDFREMAKLKNKISLIKEGRYAFRGRLI